MTLDKEFLGKKGILFELTQELKSLPHAQKAVAGKLINVLKQEIILTLQKEKEILQRNQLNAKLLQEEIDPTLPGLKFFQGSAHPLIKSLNKLKIYFYL